MWQGLDEIDWAALEHAYGSAEDVPDMLRRLNSDDDEVRDNAYYEAYGNIFHQGSRFPATPVAVPFLLRILERPDYPAHADLMHFLAALVVGYDSIFIPTGFGDAIREWREQLESGPEDEEDRIYLEAFVRITDEVRKGVGRYVELLEDPDAAVRIAATYLLAWLPESLPDFAAALTRCATGDESDQVRANALIALGLSGERSEATLALMKDALGADDGFLRGAAAIGLSCLNVHDAAAVGELASVVARYEEPDDAMEKGEPWHFPWQFGEVDAVAIACLSALSGATPEVVMEALEKGLDGMGTMQASSAVGTALNLLLPDGFSGDSPHALTPMQRRLLDLLASTSTPWQFEDAIFANFVLIMREYGLPETREDLVRFLDGRSPDPT